MTRPLILLSNDDGYRAEGLQVLRTVLLTAFDVVVCAPSAEQSAASHSLTLRRPLRLEEHGEGVYSVDGTPADSVYVALHSGTRVLPRRPALVLSGMNHGLNLGSDVIYSGTVAAAREGALRGIPALALSAAEGADLGRAAELSLRLAQGLLASETGAMLLNVNFPPEGQWRLCATRLGIRSYGEGLVRRHDPRGKEYYWVGTGGVVHDSDPGTDTEAHDAGDVGITPLVLEHWASERADFVTRLAATS